MTRVVFDCMENDSCKCPRHTISKLENKISIMYSALDAITHPVTRKTHLGTIILELQNIARIALQKVEDV